MHAHELLAERFEADRPHLRDVAYRLLGSLADAEDAVQQAWLKAARADLRDVRNLSGWLTTVTARECLDVLRARRRRGEVAWPGGEAGDHLATTGAEPGRTAEEELLLAESVGLALLVVLSRLSPAQRVAFVLHDLFTVPFADIGQVLDRSPAAAKKLASRARELVRGSGSGGERLGAEHVPLVAAFLAASRGGDLPALLDLLAPGVVRRVDPILVPADVATEIRGSRAVAEETRRFAARARAGAVAWVDGAPGIVIAPRGRLQAVLRLTIDAGLIQAIDIIGTPQRLHATTIALPETAW
ncbi:DNA-directed RNA polymerase sigma-70 factor [Sphaerisporangium melleum]|uniref:DNA-directed RNA polymerase sigma-70 factor n=1 Tax=Sphaerisporangium melleum TaxID=321316 RepID=A0A917QQF5_9ACTN|nr:sigma-70 family RNA polymerase sigma factor [Sphaerisporangium melleum]GGK63087.1 DNA-directed RNA polymerase sigma-70 factor [Sphaerisporangium melleum]GII68043.1 DNA-directed RNA polymerase sigma-70 factor [Sphaerisporangium melleum]